MQNVIFKGLNGHFKIAAATQYITRIKDSTKNILIYSQMIFHLDERHSLKATVLGDGKNSINWVSVGNFEILSRPNR